MATKLGKKKATDVPQCPYGAQCYRKNPQHFVDFVHPKKAKTSDSGSDSGDGNAADSTDGGSGSVTSPPATPKLPTTDASSLPVCKYGAKCYRKNLMHFAEYSHPTAVVSSISSQDDDDTDELSDEDEVPPLKKDVKSADILKGGTSTLVKSYTKMTEAERKELIKKAFAAKEELEKELAKTKAEVKKKDAEVLKLQKEVATGLLLMEGEANALKGTKTVYFDLVPQRAYKEGSAAQTHFRLAESQFYRLLTGCKQDYRLTKVEYVVNPELVEHFRRCQEALKKDRGEECCYPVLAFHGTEQKNIDLICQNGFIIPGDHGHTHRTDTGWYGKGIYFSEYPMYSMGYIQGGNKFLLCQVLPGKVFQCTKLIHGAALKKGYDSHTSPDKKELVIFNKYHILPSYIVHYTDAKTEFKYTDSITAPPVTTTKGAKAATTKKGAKAATTPAVTTKKGAKAAKGKTGKKTLTVDEIFDETLLAQKYTDASAMPKSKVFAGMQIQFTGKFQGTQKDMVNLIVKHGATQGTKNVFSVLIATSDEFENVTKKCSIAWDKGVRIMAEMYIYESIINKKAEPDDDFDMDVIV